MGAFGDAMQAAAGETVQFNPDYCPDKLWTGNGYVTAARRNYVKDILAGGDEMSDEDILMLIVELDLYEGKVPEEEVQQKIDEYVLNAVATKSTQRGTDRQYSKWYPLMIIIGIRDFCIMEGIIASGGEPRVEIVKKSKRNMHGYVISQE